MKGCHIVLGLPRSGSTLACVLLNQNPAFHATATSDTPQQLDAITSTWTGFEATSMRAADERAEKESELESIRCYLHGKRIHHEHQTVFDKSRAWGEKWLAFKQLYPDGKALIFLRDTRQVVGSILKRDSEHPLLSLFQAGVHTPEQKMQQLMQPDQMLGLAVRNSVACYRWAGKDALTLRLDRWTDDPVDYFDSIYRHIGAPAFAHDFENVEGHGGELDAMLAGKYPHRVYGPVTPPDPHEWRKYLTPEMGAQLHAAYPEYNQILEGPDEWENQP